MADFVQNVMEKSTGLVEDVRRDLEERPFNADMDSSPTETAIEQVARDVIDRTISYITQETQDSGDTQDPQ
ncbi:hypothetical protein BGZ97_005373 [Linnemannia gamsii]|jgi:hypothetical protein|uniref:Uncharacterized protein n=1 Tax=Linnemannia gamsii TaxID=64522 RepID=A0A9P6UGE9_9FUNG|nr:hypothetical protein BGZ97_005373 [Linnemannia gamsii]